MKLSAKETKEKSRLKTEKLLQEKLELEKVRFEAIAQKELAEKKIKDIAEKCLATALVGQTTISLGIHDKAENANLKKLLGGKASGFDFIETDAYLYRTKKLTDFLKQYPNEKIDALRFKVSSIALSIQETYQEHQEYLDYELCNLELAARQKTALHDQILYLHIAFDTYTNFFSKNKDIGLNKIDKLFRKYFDELAALLPDTYLFTSNSGIDNIELTLSWEAFSGDDCINLYEQATYFFTPTALGWLASHHGQLFLGALEVQIEEAVEQSENSAAVSLSKYSSGFYLVIQDDVEFQTLLDEKALTSLFSALGYRVKCLQTSEDEFTIQISW